MFYFIQTSVIIKYKISGRQKCFKVVTKHLYIQIPSSVQYHINVYYALSIVTSWITQLRAWLRQVCLFKKLKKIFIKRRDWPNYDFKLKWELFRFSWDLKSHSSRHAFNTWHTFVINISMWNLKQCKLCTEGTKGISWVWRDASQPLCQPQANISLTEGQVWKVSGTQSSNMDELQTIKLKQSWNQG